MNSKEVKAWDIVEIARHKDRPNAKFYIENMK